MNTRLQSLIDTDANAALAVRAFALLRKVDCEKLWAAVSAADIGAVRGPELFALAEAAAFLEDRVQEPRCRKCGCTENDCVQCIEKTGGPCHWVEIDLCSACVAPSPAPPKNRRKLLRPKRRRSMVKAH